MSETNSKSSSRYTTEQNKFEFLNHSSKVFEEEDSDALGNSLIELETKMARERENQKAAIDNKNGKHLEEKSNAEVLNDYNKELSTHFCLAYLP